MLTKIMEKILLCCIISFVLPQWGMAEIEPFKIKTPKGTVIVAYTRDDLRTQEEIEKATQKYVKKYPKAKLLAKSSLTYNCHGYSWYMTEPGHQPDVLILGEDESTYWEDGSYEEVKGISSPFDVDSNVARIIYYPLIIDTHSGLPTNQKGWVRSKWGEGPRMEHEWNYSPYTVPEKWIRYYARSSDSETDTAFLIDDTGSMSEEIDGVRQALLAYLDLYPDSSSDTVFQLTTFKDDVTMRDSTTTLSEIESQVAGLVARGGGDCPEASVEAIQAMHPHLDAGSRVLLATDASPHSGLDLDSTVAELRGQGVSVDIILSDDCEPYEPPAPTMRSVSGLSAPTNRITPSTGGGFPLHQECVTCTQAALASSETRLRSTTSTSWTATGAFSLLARETGGVFAFLPEVNTGSSTAREHYEQTVFNLLRGSLDHAVSLVTPATVLRDSTVTLSVVGSQTNFLSGATTVTIAGEGVRVEHVTVISPMLLEATVSIAASATSGFRTLVTQTDLGGGYVETAEGHDLLEIAPNTSSNPTITSLTPVSGALGNRCPSPFMAIRHILRHRLWSRSDKE